MTSSILVPALTAALFLTACAENGTVTSANNVDPISLATAPPGAAPGSCWGKTSSPAIVETVTRKVLVQPAQVSSDGRVQAPPIYKEETKAEVITPRKNAWFEIPCAEQLTPDFVSSLQRALQARGYHRGKVTGEMDARTRDAVRRYQKDQGLKQKVLTVAGARTLGLIAVERTPNA
ncbi:MAG: peptidoglycan-binding domain-containing protein [Tateyamaria sp.]|uniref:peptidoglycan-binding domain-containing protein n=1 Tax=Tateyamaria sp. TaxID=1929288 RepID=UPI00329B9805